MAYLWLLIIIVIVVIVLLLIMAFSSSQVVVYYQYPNDQHLELGTFGTDPVIVSSRLFTVYSDSGLTQNVGSLQTGTEYTQYPLNNQMYFDKKMTLNTGGNMYIVNVSDQYISDPPARPTTYNFGNAFVSASNQTYYIGKKVSITNVTGNVYKLVLNA